MNLIILFAAGEILIRVFCNVETINNMIWNKELQMYWYKPQSVIKHSAKNFIFEYSTDTLGFRKIENPTHAVPHRIRLLLLGDSFTFGVGVEMPYAQILNEMGYVVHNLGMSSTGSKHQFKIWSRYYQPCDFIILQTCENDNREDRREDKEKWIRKIPFEKSHLIVQLNYIYKTIKYHFKELPQVDTTQRKWIERDCVIWIKTTDFYRYGKCRDGKHWSQLAHLKIAQYIDQEIKKRIVQ